VVETVSTPSLASSTKRKFLQVVPGPQTLTTPSQNQTQTQNIDLLYCETCNGIPFDRYQRMHLVLNESVHGFRRTLSLTRSMLYSVFGMDEDQINTTLCPAFFNTQQEAVSDGLAHSLRCGHGVLCAQMRPCASNCTDSATCFASNVFAHERHGDAIICQECVFRSELVLRRWTATGKPTGYHCDSGFV
jgi:hypothetical protein